MSLRTGSQIGLTTKFIINPKNLKIEGFYCMDKSTNSQLVLLSQDVRDILAQGIAVNDHEVLTETIDLVRLKEVLELDFQVLGKPVVTKTKKRLGKVGDFAVEAETMYIQKLYVNPPWLKSLTSGQLSVERNQIIEITSRKIIVKDPLQPIKEKFGTESTPATATANS
jgi:sporulation protein YlmC with PRC-barrel domain